MVSELDILLCFLVRSINTREILYLLKTTKSPLKSGLGINKIIVLTLDNTTKNNCENTASFYRILQAIYYFT